MRKPFTYKINMRKYNQKNIFKINIRPNNSIVYVFFLYTFYNDIYLHYIRLCRTKLKLNFPELYVASMQNNTTYPRG